MVRPYLIPVGKTITDPTGTMTLKVMAYFYEPATGCGVAYVRLSEGALQRAGEFSMPRYTELILNLYEKVKCLR